MMGYEGAASQQHVMNHIVDLASAICGVRSRHYTTVGQDFTTVVDYCWLALSGQRSGHCPSMCVQAVGGGLGGRRLRLVTRAHLRWLDRRPSAYTKMLYKDRWPLPNVTVKLAGCCFEAICSRAFVDIDVVTSKSVYHVVELRLRYAMINNNSFSSENTIISYDSYDAC